MVKVPDELMRKYERQRAEFQRNVEKKAQEESAVWGKKLEGHLVAELIAERDRLIEQRRQEAMVDEILAEMLALAALPDEE